MDLEHINYVINAHNNFAKNPKKACRKWDGQTPYAIHPIWCATMIASETQLNSAIRENGFYTLLYHDILEETTQSIEHLPPNIQTLVRNMTFEGGSAQEQEEIWQKSPDIRLYKLYDKVSNLLDSRWMNHEKKKAYADYTARLNTDVIEGFGHLNITTIASGVIFND